MSFTEKLFGVVVRAIVKTGLVVAVFVMLGAVYSSAGADTVKDEPTSVIQGGDTCADAVVKVRFPVLDNDVYFLTRDGKTVANSKQRKDGEVVIVGPALLPGESSHFALKVSVPDDTTQTVTTLEEKDITRPTLAECNARHEQMPDYYPGNHLLPAS